ncbi:hypothetical protein HOD02_01910 [bacterium]|jgi:hypothetical protein|nr:hypothetical protein [bacterium]|tara:strand:+ start:402 stop:698 length:297 start_codon:yes stop_codon:yes gene_type:complete
MLNFKFKKKLLTTQELLTEINLSLGWLDLHKTKWRKAGNDSWDMGLRKIGTKAFWDPIIFTEWLFTNGITNKPTNKMERAENAALITFVRSNAEYDNR